MIKKLITAVVLCSALPGFASGAGVPNEITCEIEGTLTQLFFDGQSDAEGELHSGEIVVARSIGLNDDVVPDLTMLETILMRVEFPFRLEGEDLVCEVYHPSRWWFNQPALRNILGHAAFDTRTSQ
jgi:hypothetical protein